MKNTITKILNIFNQNKTNCCPVCGRYYSSDSIYNAQFCKGSHNNDKPEDIYNYPVNRMKKTA